jgi:hypothetical protein
MDEKPRLRVKIKNLFSCNLYFCYFSGEAVIASEDNVLQFVPLSERRHGRSGALIVTNFKLSFIPSVGTLNTVSTELTTRGRSVERGTKVGISGKP